MELIIKGTPKELAALVVQVQGRQVHVEMLPTVYKVSEIGEFQKRIQKRYQDQCNLQEG